MCSYNRSYNGFVTISVNLPVTLCACRYIRLSIRLSLPLSCSLSGSPLSVGSSVCVSVFSSFSLVVYCGTVAAFISVVPSTRRSERSRNQQCAIRAFGQRGPPAGFCDGSNRLEKHTIQVGEIKCHVSFSLRKVFLVSLISQKFPDEWSVDGRCRLVSFLCFFHFGTTFTKFKIIVDEIMIPPPNSSEEVSLSIRNLKYPFDLTILSTTLLICYIINIIFYITYHI